ncbi:MAG: SpvB/TcaC N-terminal domain-containing protein, partial [Vicinamibacteria bacterium]
MEANPIAATEDEEPIARNGRPVVLQISNRVLRFVLVTLIFATAPGFAQVSGNTGAYSTTIPIQVPTHRGLEPSISLVYNSLAGNGIAGVGWGLTGFPVIERQGADGGTPQFNGTDSFRWGGED